MQTPKMAARGENMDYLSRVWRHAWREGWTQSRVALMYALFASLWIGQTDALLAALTQDPHEIARLGTYKGWLFVAVTTLLVYRWSAHSRREKENLQRAETALQKTVTDLKSFSYIISHDLRAPLAAIRSFAEAVNELEAARLSDQGRHRLERIVSGAKRMDAMIADILAFSRADSANLQLAPVNLQALAQEVALDLREQWPGTEILVRPLPVVCADPATLRQVLHNLVGNALKFSSHKSGARVEIDAKVVNGDACVEVRDNGEGFDMAYASKLFGLFQRLHTEAEFPGTGMGLAIVKRVIDRHGGTVHAESTPGGWTTFSFTLRVAHGAGDGRAPTAANGRVRGQSRLACVARDRRQGDESAKLVHGKTLTPLKAFA
jgi:signal transduction histidine kinase